MYPRAVKGVVILLLVFMFTINFFGGIYPRSQVKNNPDMEVVNFIKRYVNKGVIVLAGMGDWYAGKVYIPHFVKVPRLSFDLFISKYGRKEGLEKFERKIYYWALYNGHVYLLSGLLDSKKVHEQIYKYLKIKKGDIERIFEPYEKKLIASYDKRDIKIYRLLPQKGWPVYHNMVGYDFMMKRKYEKAIYNFEKGLDSKFDFDVDVLISLGKCYLIIGKPERTIKLWEKAFTLFPNYSQELKRILEELKTKHEK
jgi:tetratricopeptide (TPR) repeat protein